MAVTDLNLENSNLMKAVFNESVEDVERLLARGANPNFTDTPGNTPLFKACIFEAAGMVELLLNHDADPNTFNRNGETLLVR